MMLELQDINKSYGQEPMLVPVLHHIDLQVEESEYLAIMGPSGSGKTTLMNIIGCLDHATSGSYFLDGEDISKLKDEQLSKVRLEKIGFVFQSFELLAEETALENVALPLIYAGKKKDEREQAAKEALARVGLADRVSFYPNELSGGQKQRVAIARAMINHPKLLLADEPTGALDQESGAQIMDLFADLAKEGVTIIMITHDAKVASHAKRLVHIIDGKLIEGGDAS